MAKRANTALKTRAKILLVDDHPLVRRGLAELINEEPGLEVCGDAEDVEDALQKVKRERPQVVVIDISLKTGHGLDLIKKIRSFDDTILMLVSSMHDESLYAERVLQAGASGFVNKQESPEKVIEAIRTVLEGKVFLSPRMTDRFLHRIIETRTSAGKHGIDLLSDRELEVLEMVGRGHSTREVADQLCISTKTIESHRENIKTKLDLRNAAELTRYAVQWVLENN